MLLHTPCFSLTFKYFNHSYVKNLKYLQYYRVVVFFSRLLSPRLNGIIKAD